MTARLEWIAGLLDRFYSKSLLLYPVEFRVEFGTEMMQFFRDDCRRTARRSGVVGLLLLAIRCLLDVARSAPGVHMEILKMDIRYSWRTLRSSRMFSFTAIAALALGIGANGAVFSLVNSILLHPLPFPNAERLVTVWQKNPKGIDRNAVSPPDWLDFRAGARSLAGIAAFYENSANLQISAEPEHVTSYVVSSDFFDVLGVRPMFGPGLEASAASPPGAILSHKLWLSRFGADRSIIGRALRIDDREYSIRGVMPPDFRFPSQATALWTSMTFDPARFSRQAHFLTLIGRLKPGVRIEESRADIEVLAARTARAFPASNRGWGATILFLQEQVIGDARKSLAVFMGAVVMVLLIACANISNLLLARNTNREGEMAVRTAIGASTVRLARQIVTESLLLAVIGGAAGLALAALTIEVLKAIGPAAIPRLEEVTVSGWTFAFTMALSLITGVACGLVPAWRVSRTDLNAGLKRGGLNRKSLAAHGLRGWLITSEVALSLLLMLGAGLLIRTFLNLQQLDPGFKTSGVVTLTLDMPQVRYPHAADRAALMEQAAARVRALPGVDAAGVISNLPLTGGEGYNRFGFTIEGKESPTTTENHRFYGRWITPGYRHAMGIPLLRGRDFSEADRAGAPPVVIVDSALVRRYFPGEDPIGKFIRLSYARSETREIIGLVGEVRLLGLDVEPAPQIYIPALQEARSPTMNLVLRSSLPLSAAGESARAALRELDRSLPVYDVQSIADVVSESVAARRFNTLLMSVLAGLALVLSAIGVCGVVSCMANEKQREIGVRIALGARRGDILALIVRQGMKHALVGTVIGLTAALLLSRTLSSLLYSVGPLDPWSFAAAATILLVVAFLACLIPALRSAHVDPLRTLRM